jgi:hypothetical protein
MTTEQYLEANLNLSSGLLYPWFHQDTLPDLPAHWCYFEGLVFYAQGCLHLDASEGRFLSHLHLPECAEIKRSGDQEAQRLSLVSRAPCTLEAVLCFALLCHLIPTCDHCTVIPPTDGGQRQ